MGRRGRLSRGEIRTDRLAEPFRAGGGRSSQGKALRRENSMSRYIGVIFPDEAKANEGSRVLKDLHAEGSITLSGMAVVAKDATGTLSKKKSVDEGSAWAGGALIGGFGGVPCRRLCRVLR